MNGAIYRPDPIFRSELRKSWIRSFPCLVCGRPFGIEAAHCGPHGMSQKASDSMLVPLCHPHHRSDNNALDKIGRLRFEMVFGVDVLEAAEEFAAKFQVRIEGALYVGTILRESGEEGDLEQYELGLVADGPRAMLQTAIGFARERLTVLYYSERRTWRG